MYHEQGHTSPQTLHVPHAQVLDLDGALAWPFCNFQLLCNLRGGILRGFWIGLEVLDDTLYTVEVRFRLGGHVGTMF